MQDETQTGRKLTKYVTIPQIAAIAVGLLYVSGYYINSIFLRNYGITDSELLRLEYIKIGFVFALITLGLVFLPLGAFMLTYRVRRASKLPHYHIGAIGNSLNVVLMLGVPLFLVFFATKYEWFLELPHPILGLATFQQVMIVFIAISVFAVVMLPYLERVVTNKTQGPTTLALYRFAIEPIRYGALAVSVLLVLGALSQIPWIGSLFQRGTYFVLAAVVFVVGMWAATRWIRHIRPVQGAYLVYPLICFGIAILYYMAIASYVFGVYTMIPCNRGGKLPVTVAYLEVQGHGELFAEEKTISGVRVRGPAYIIDENAECIFVASEQMNSWLDEFVPIHAIRRDSVPYVYLERINDGFPRVKRP